MDQALIRKEKYNVGINRKLGSEKQSYEDYCNLHCKCDCESGARIFKNCYDVAKLR